MGTLGQGETNTLQWRDQAVADGLALRGPDMGILDVNTTNGGYCHPNTAGETLLGQELFNFFDAGNQATWTPGPSPTVPPTVAVTNTPTSTPSPTTTDTATSMPTGTPAYTDTATDMPTYTPTATTTATLIGPTAHSIGYIGCSNTVQAIQGYHNVPANRDLFWENTNYNLGGGSMDMWAPPTSSYWTLLDDQIAVYGQPQGVWIEMCVKPNTGTTYATITQVLSILRSHVPNATFFVSPLNEYAPTAVCPMIGDFWLNTIGWSDQTQADALALRGPDLGPFDSSLLDTDLCHLNGAGSDLAGRQLMDYFDNGQTATSTSTAVPTDTPMYTNTPASLPTLTPTYTSTPTSIASDTPTYTDTAVPADTATTASTNTAAATKASTPTNTATSAPTGTATGAPTNTPAATDTPAGTTVNQDNTSIQYDCWRGVKDPSASGGTYRVCNVKNAFVTFSFSGTSATWISLNGPDQGKAQIQIDGVSQGTFDLYSSTVTYNARQSFGSLSNATHTFRVIVNGSKNASSTGTNVAVDGFIVNGTTIQDNCVSTWYDHWEGQTSPSAYNGNYRTNSYAGTDTKFTFTGTSVSWITAKGHKYGQANVLIDGASQGTVDLYSPTQQWQVALTYGGLSAGQHTIDIQPLGAKNPASAGTDVVVDAFSGPITMSSLLRPEREGNHREDWLTAFLALLLPGM